MLAKKQQALPEPSGNKRKSRRLRILIAEPRPVILPALGAIFESSIFEVVHKSVPQTARLGAAIADSRPHLLLLDLEITGQQPVVALRKLRQHHPSIRILAVGTSRNLSLVSRLLLAGADGYEFADSDPEDLAEAIDDVAHGCLHLAEDLAR